MFWDISYDTRQPNSKFQNLQRRDDEAHGEGGVKIPVPSMDDLRRFIRNGNVEEVRRLLINSPAGSQPPIYEAVRTGNHEMVQLVLDHGANVMGQSNVTSPLHVSCHLGFESIVRLLLSRDANVNAVEMDDGETPLFFACRAGHTQLISLLVENGADIHAKNWSGQTPLHFACQMLRPNDEDVVEALVQNGADLEATNRQGLPPLHLVCAQQNVRMAYLLVELGCNVNAYDDSVRTPLLHACESRAINIVRMLLENEAHPELPTRLCESPLHLVSSNGNAALVKVLLEHGASLHHKNIHGQMPLDCATRSFQGNHRAVTFRLMEAHIKQDLLKCTSFHPCLFAHLFGKINCYTHESKGATLIYSVLREKPDLINLAANSRKRKAPEGFTSGR